MWELKNKKTSKTHLVDDTVYEELKGNGLIKKFVVAKVPDSVIKNVIPEEIIQKKAIKKEKETDQK